MTRIAKIGLVVVFALLLGLTYHAITADAACQPILGKFLSALRTSRYRLLTPLAFIPLVLLFGSKTKWLLPPLLAWGIHFGNSQIKTCGTKPFCFQPYDQPRSLQGYTLLDALEGGADTINMLFFPFFKLRQMLQGATIIFGSYSPSAHGYRLPVLTGITDVKQERYYATLTENSFKAIIAAPGVESFFFNDIGVAYVVPNPSKVYRVYGYKANMVLAETVPHVQ